MSKKEKYCNRTETKQEYHVSWDIDIAATSPKLAAMEALQIQRDAASIATVFRVTNKHSGKNSSIDLSGTHKGLKPYSVLLLYPDYLQESGNATYFNWTRAHNPHEALAKVRKMAQRANRREVEDPDDFALLAVISGHVDLELGSGDD